jgi:hypothetical protein
MISGFLLDVTLPLRLVALCRHSSCPESTPFKVNFQHALERIGRQGPFSLTSLDSRHYSIRYDAIRIVFP